MKIFLLWNICAFLQTLILGQSVNTNDICSSFKASIQQHKLKQATDLIVKYSENIQILSDCLCDGISKTEDISIKIFKLIPLINRKHQYYETFEDLKNLAKLTNCLDGKSFYPNQVEMAIYKYELHQKLNGLAVRKLQQSFKSNNTTMLIDTFEDLKNLAKLTNCLDGKSFYPNQEKMAIFKYELQQKLNGLAVRKLQQSFKSNNTTMLIDIDHILVNNLSHFHLLRLAQQAVAYVRHNEEYFKILILIKATVKKTDHPLILNIYLVIKLYDKMRTLKKDTNSVQIAAADIIQMFQAHDKHSLLPRDVQLHIQNTRQKLTPHIQTLLFSKALCLLHSENPFYLEAATISTNGLIEYGFGLNLVITANGIWKTKNAQNTLISFYNKDSQIVVYPPSMSHSWIRDSFGSSEKAKRIWQLIPASEVSTQFYIENVYNPFKLCARRNGHLFLSKDRKTIQPCLWSLGNCFSLLNMNLLPWRKQ